MVASPTRRDNIQRPPTRAGSRPNSANDTSIYSLTSSASDNNNINNNCYCSNLVFVFNFCFQPPETFTTGVLIFLK